MIYLFKHEAFPQFLYVFVVMFQLGPTWTRQLLASWEPQAQNVAAVPERPFDLSKDLRTPQNSSGLDYHDPK